MNVFFSLDRDIFEGLLFVVVSKKRFKNISINSCIKKKGTKRSVGRAPFFFSLRIALSLSLFSFLSRSRSSPRFASSRLVVFRNPAGDKTSRHDRAGIDDGSLFLIGILFAANSASKN